MPKCQKSKCDILGDFLTLCNSVFNFQINLFLDYEGALTRNCALVRIQLLNGRLLTHFVPFQTYCERKFYSVPKNATFKSYWSSNLCINLLNPPWITKNKLHSQRKSCKKKVFLLLVCLATLAVAYVFLSHISWKIAPLLL